jgi:hypothetical protein
LLLGVFAALAGATSASAATRECNGLQICVPIAGPWVVVPVAVRTVPIVQYQLDCPRGYIVGGLDAELTTREIDVSFAGSLGSPVNPGITTGRSAVFSARHVGEDRAARPTFRPHIGCIPTSGGGGRTPTSVSSTVPPGHPTIRRVKNLLIQPGTWRTRQACAAGERLISASYAIGFYTTAPPTAIQIAAVRGQLAVRGQAATVTLRAGRLTASVRTALQIGVDCAGGR